MAQDYRITGQDATTGIAPNGRGFQNIWEVSYLVTDGPAKGTTGRVDVPEADHNAEYIDRAIRSKISDLHDIASLGSSGS